MTLLNTALTLQKMKLTVLFFLQCLVLKQAAAAILENRGHKSILVECYDEEDFTFCECFSISPFDDRLQVSGVSLLE